MFGLKIKQNELDELIKKLKDREPLFRAVGKKVVRQAKDNARKRGKGSSFWKSIAESVSCVYSNNSLVVGSTHHVSAHKQFGGTISAPGRGEGSKHASYLTIPIAPESKGKRVRDFNGFFGIKSKAGNTMFSIKDGKGFKPLFVLVKSVTQKAYPWFPEGTQLDRAINNGIKNIHGGG